MLIDDSGKALLCDFGLARVKADISSRSTVTDMIDTAVVAGSRYWMAPERLIGKPLKKPCDVYSFSMTAYEVGSILGEVLWEANIFIYQIYADEIPLGYISPGELLELVVRQHIRPEQPDGDVAPQLTNEVWQLFERCWDSNPLQRPLADAICVAISSLQSPLPSLPTDSRANTPTTRSDTNDAASYLHETGTHPTDMVFSLPSPPFPPTPTSPASLPLEPIPSLHLHEATVTLAKEVEAIRVEPTAELPESQQNVCVNLHARIQHFNFICRRQSTN